jgi:hypothetical protein
MARTHTLVEIYKLLNNRNFANSYDSSVHPLNCLKNSLEFSINNMRVQNPKALELFCLIGLMPGGVCEETLEVLWGSDCNL